MWFVYLLLCKNNTVYTGITTDLDKRMRVHQSGKGSKYVARAGFEKLLYSIRCENRSDASKIEYAVKQLDRNTKIDFFLQHPTRIQELNGTKHIYPAHT